LQARKGLGDEAFAPAADGVPVAAQLVGDVLVGRAARGCRGQDDAATQRQSLGSGAGADQGFEFGAKLVRQFNHRTEGTRHGSPPGKVEQLVVLLFIM
jgi:hypothetical protein